MKRICFVCLGNICRSPTAAGILRVLRPDLHVESAGTAAYHVGELADHRTRKTASSRGVELTTRAQHFAHALFARFDLVIAMDNDNKRNLEQLAQSDADRAKIRLLRDYDATCKKGSNVPDPYYGEQADFDLVYEICERACRALSAAIDAGNA